MTGRTSTGRTGAGRTSSGRTSAGRRARRLLPAMAGALAFLVLAICAGLLTAPRAAAGTAVQDAVDSSVAAAAADGIKQSVSVVDRDTGARVAGSGGDEQYISESIVKLFTVAYYAVEAGGQPAESMASRLRTMIIHSDDEIESALWNVDIVPSMAARYGLAHTSNGPKTGPHDWGWELITADDEADFLFKMSHDPQVAPLLMDAMANVAPTGSDGFDQHFGLNAVTGDHGSKQGWTDVGSSRQVQIHSVGWTDRYFVAILQTSTDSDYDTMRAASTRTALAVQAAGVAETDGNDSTRSTPATTTPAPAPVPATPPGPRRPRTPPRRPPADRRRPVIQRRRLSRPCQPPQPARPFGSLPRCNRLAATSVRQSLDCSARCRAGNAPGPVTGRRREHRAGSRRTGVRITC